MVFMVFWTQFKEFLVQIELWRCDASPKLTTNMMRENCSPQAKILGKFWPEISVFMFFLDEFWFSWFFHGFHGWAPFSWFSWFSWLSESPACYQPQVWGVFPASSSACVMTMCSPPQVWARSPQQLSSSGHTPHLTFGRVPHRCLGKTPPQAEAMFPTSSSGHVPHLKFGACSPVPTSSLGRVPHLKFRLCSPGVWGVFHTVYIATKNENCCKYLIYFKFNCTVFQV